MSAVPVTPQCSRPDVGAVVGGDAGTFGAAPRYEIPRTPLNFSWSSRRLPVILQSEAAECGLACLAMVACYHGFETDLASLRRRFSLSLKGATLSRLIEMAQALGLQGRPLRLELDELDQLKRPCILHWGLNHFVVLKAVRGRVLVIHDPAQGERTVSREEASRQFTGVALELSPTPNFRKAREVDPFNWRALMGRVHGLKSALSEVMVLALLLEILALLSPLFTQTIIDQVLADGDHDLLTVLGIGFVLMLLVQTAVSALRSWTVMRFGTSLHLAWAGNVFSHLLRLPEEYFGKRHLGDIVSRFSAVHAIQHTLTTRVVEVLLDGLMATLTLGVMLVYSFKLTGIVLAAFLLYVLIRALSYRVQFEATSQQVVSSAKQQSRFLEAVRGSTTIRLHNQSAAQSARYMNATTDTLNRGLVVQRLNLIFGSCSQLIFGLENTAVYWVGALLALSGSFSAGMLIAFTMYCGMFTSRASSLVDYAVQVKMLRLQGQRLADIVLTPPERHVETNYAGPLPAASIAVRNLGFRYAEGERWIVRHLNLDIAAGESVAIVGPSGMGKSTLAKLLLGLLEPQEGEIQIGGIELKRLGKRSYRAMLGAVLQDDTLFAGSIADNISFFDPEATPLRVEAAARLAQIHDDIVAMPMGYHSLVGDMGSTLSGGQRQRVILARALYRRPKILVLDEATSHLDLATERAVNAAIQRLQITRIVLAHRAETIASAQRVIDLSKLREPASQPIAGQQQLPCGPDARLNEEKCDA
nr:peptidase domain-containing ABC transporter [Metallibacterium scheffleri]